MKLRVILVGLLMGAAEVVPGVSGGTIAFVSGLYERLLTAISRLTPMALLLLPRLGLKAWWQKFDLSFLFLLFGAMGVSVVLLARVVSHLLETHPIGIWSFFFGLVVASIVIVGKRVVTGGVSAGAALGAGIAIGLIVTRLVPVEAEVTPLALFAGGSIAVCAWILPGLSGSFILLTLGLYQAVIVAIRDFDLLTLTWLGLGCVAGLLAFSRVLSALLNRFHDVTVASLVGFMVGSLVRIWPWQHTTSYQLKPDGSQIPLVQEPVLPNAYEQLTGAPAELVIAAIAACLGMAMIVIMNRFALLAESDDSRPGE